MCIDGDGYGDTQELANLIPDALNYEFFNYWRLSYSYINTRRDMMQVRAFILFLYDLLLYLMIDAMYRLNLLW